MKKVSIIIVNYNGLEWLPLNLKSIENQNYNNIEVILVDNNSTDNSVDYVSKNFPKTKIIENKENFGFAKGNNIGLKVSTGDFIFLLNNDAYILDKDLFKKLIKFMEQNKDVAVIQPKIILENSRENIDVAGSFYTPTTLLYHRGYHQNKNIKLLNKPSKIFSAKGAAMFIDRKVIDKVGLFDSKFWCYYEETDFCHRVWMIGKECWYVPLSSVMHFEGSTSSKFNNNFVQYHSFKNKLRSYIKNFNHPELEITIIKYLIFSLIYIFISSAKLNFASIFVVLKAIFWNILNLKNTLEMRKKISRNEIPKSIIKKPRFSYYWYAATSLSKLPKDQII